jgi:hypothetical protein
MPDYNIIENLPRDYKKLAELRTTYKNEQTIFSAFTWGATPEGGYFWASIKIAKEETKLPPLPEVSIRDLNAVGHFTDAQLEENRLNQEKHMSSTDERIPEEAMEKPNEFELEVGDVVEIYNGERFPITGVDFNSTFCYLSESENFSRNWKKNGAHYENRLSRLSIKKIISKANSKPNDESMKEVNIETVYNAFKAYNSTRNMFAFSALKVGDYFYKIGEKYIIKSIEYEDYNGALPIKIYPKINGNWPSFDDFKFFYSNNFIIEPVEKIDEESVKKQDSAPQNFNPEPKQSITNNNYFHEPIIKKHKKQNVKRIQLL